jgi:hypothetical protein
MEVRKVWPRVLVNLAIVCLAGFIVGIVLRGGGQVTLLGIRVSFNRLYTPVLVLTLLVALRVWLSVRVRLTNPTSIFASARHAAVAGLACIAVLSPLLSVTLSSVGDRNWIRPDVMWRNSAPGLDLLAYVAPNPLNPLFGWISRDWIASLPNGFNENVASLPWVMLVTILGAVVWAGYRPLRGWVIFTGAFALLALGPFITVAKQLTYIPTPWALLRYLPIVGSARMPTRLTILVMLGLSMLLAMALAHIRSTSKRPRLIAIAVATLLFIELLPAPRTLTSAEIPLPYRVIAKDPRPIRVISLPIGLKDGISSRGNYSASSQFYQTHHQKRLVGGYVSRLPSGTLESYRTPSVMRVLLRLSEGTPVDDELYNRALSRADAMMQRLQVGYVVIDRRRTSPELAEFAKRAFKLQFMLSDDHLDLYRTPVE